LEWNTVAGSETTQLEKGGIKMVQGNGISRCEKFSKPGSGVNYTVSQKKGPNFETV